jgi:hypothetical protein
MRKRAEKGFREFIFTAATFALFFLLFRVDEFIHLKNRNEQKIKELIEPGFTGSLTEQRDN